MGIPRSRTVLVLEAIALRDQIALLQFQNRPTAESRARTETMERTTLSMLATLRRSILNIYTFRKLSESLVGAGHSVYFEQPDEFNRTIETSCARHR